MKHLFFTKSSNKVFLFFVFVIIFFGFQITNAYASAFISTWDTTKAGSAANTIILPITGNYTVDWGDASTTSNIATHVYSVATTSVTISVTGSTTSFRFNNAGDKLKIKNISQWGDLLLGNDGGYFYGCANLKITATDILNTSGITNMINAFNGSGIDTVPNMGSWDMSNVTNMSYMFYQTGAFNQDIGGWNISNATNTSNMFYSSSFNNGGSPSIGNWNTSKVTDMTSMFQYATSINQNIGGWDVSKVTSMNSMFFGANAFNNGGSPSINNWNPASNTGAWSMFRSAWAFNQPIGGWNTSSFVTMDYMFRDATIFDQNIGGWDTSNVTGMIAMFRFATNFNNGGSPSIGNWNTSKVTDMNTMFYVTNAFNQNIGNWDTSKVTNFGNMFSSAIAFNNGGSPAINNWNTASSTSMANMFLNASSFNQNVGSWNVTNVTSMASMFTGSILSTTNYSKTLMGWSAQSVKSSVPLNAGTSTYYTGVPATARGVLTGTKSWAITDGGATTSPTFVLSYTVSGGGSLTGSTTQNVLFGVNGTEVIANANTGYYFVDWSDGATTTSRTDTSVFSDISVTANFARYSSGGSRRIVGSCSSFDYSSWSECNNGNQTREIITSYPANCNINNNFVSPVISQSCVDEIEATTTISTDIDLSTSQQSSVISQYKPSICSPYLTSYIKLGANNEPDQVKKLQTFLNQYEGTTLVVDGIYKTVDVNAVKAFQLKNKKDVLDFWNITEPSGYVYVSTLKAINRTYCEQIKGVSCPYFIEPTNAKTTPSANEILNIRNFLIKTQNENISSTRTSIDSELTNAIKRFQTKYASHILTPWKLSKPTGLWYQSTRKYADELLGCYYPVRLDNGVVVE